ncbi:MAG TPA: cupin domain-containing protein [Bacteroidetes bacterium]|nr:cupin domain-containing protein [Bacteroidota bacterium]
MITAHYREKNIRQTPHGVDVRELYSKEPAQAIHILLQPGESLKPHITPVDVFFYVLEGNPTIHVGRESRSFPADTLVESPARIPHHISNESDTQVRILVVKAPRPTQATRLL